MRFFTEEIVDFDGLPALAEAERQSFILMIIKVPLALVIGVDIIAHPDIFAKLAHLLRALSYVFLAGASFDYGFILRLLREFVGLVVPEFEIYGFIICFCSLLHPYRQELILRILDQLPQLLIQFFLVLDVRPNIF